jgi:hypothetical protein
MALVTINGCSDCGQKWTAVNAPHASVCTACGETRRLRGLFGTGEHADMLFALYHPREYEREQTNHQRYKTLFGATP